MTQCDNKFCVLGLCTKVKPHDAVQLILGGIRCLRCSKYLTPHQSDGKECSRRRQDG